MSNVLKISGKMIEVKMTKPLTKNQEQRAEILEIRRRALELQKEFTDRLQSEFPDFRPEIQIHLHDLPEYMGKHLRPVANKNKKATKLDVIKGLTGNFIVFREFTNYPGFSDAVRLWSKKIDPRG